MADLSLKIKADFDSAQAAFNKLSKEADDAGLSLRKFVKEFPEKKADEFIAKQELAAVAMKAAGKETDIVNSQVSVYQREIERLIKSGLDPQHEAVQKLQGGLITLREKQEAQNQATKTAEDAAKAQAEAEKEKAAEVEKAAKKTVDLITTTDKYKEQTKQLKNRQQELKEEMERLIKSGIDPQSEEIKKLKDEYKKLEQEQKRAIDGMMMMEQAALASVKALALFIAGTTVAVQKTAEMGDQYAKASRQIGMTAETLQELEFAAKDSGVSNLQGSLQKLQIQMNQVRSGTGALTKALEGNNDVMLAQIKGAKNNEEAYKLVLKAIREAPDEFKRAEIAQAAFGRSGQDIILMAMQGEEALENLREEARKYGIISNDAAEASERYMDAQTRLKSALEGARTEITKELIPAFADVMNEIAGFIAGIDDWEKKITVAGIALGALTVGLTTFLAVSKGHLVITKLAGAMAALRTAITGPAGIAAIAVTALATAVGTLVAIGRRQSDQASDVARSLQDQKEKADRLLSSYASLNPSKKIDEETTRELIKLYPQLSDVIRENETTITGLSDAIEALNEDNVKNSAQPFIDNMKRTWEAAERARRQIENLGPVTRATTRDTHQAAFQQRQILERNLRDFERFRNNANTILNTIGLEVDLENNFEFVKTVETRIEELNTAIRESAIEAAKSVGQKLNEIALTEEQLMNDRINQARSFFRQRADLERTSGEERIRSYQNELARVLESGRLHGDELIALERAASESIQAVRDELNAERERAEAEAEAAALAARKNCLNEIVDMESEADEEIIKSKEELWAAERQLLEQKMAAYTTFFGGISNLISAAGKENEGALATAKVFAATEAGINSYLAFTKALTDPTPKPNIQRAAEATGILTAGLAKQVKIWQTAIPSAKTRSAETGGRFIVPDVSPRIDGVGMRVNPGEEIAVTPRGMIGQGSTFHFVFKVGENIIFDIVNKGARAGELYELQPAGNY